ncbi:MAG: LysM peptidoglycan-binding domain-containing protein [Myxococcota bacterium]
MSQGSLPLWNRMSWRMLALSTGLLMSSVYSASASAQSPVKQVATGEQAPPVAAAAASHELLQDAMPTVLLAIDSYRTGDMSDAFRNFETALDTLTSYGLPTGEEGIKLLEGQLPSGYRDAKLLEMYRACVKATQPATRSSDKSRAATTAPSGAAPSASNVSRRDDDNEVRVPSPVTEERLQAAARYLSAEDHAYVRQAIDSLVAAFGEKEYPHSETFVQEVEYFIHQYQTDLRGFFERSLVRSVKYMPMVKQTLREKGVPESMAYIAFVESGFRTTAESSAGALGLWQFMPKTGRGYGLRVDKEVDERLDPDKSTYAAREYFLDLVAIFGSQSFLLAIASYNAGEGKVQYCLKQVDDPFTQRTFWDIRSCLRKETREYIPRIIAAAIAAEDPLRFGFGKSLEFADPARYDVVLVPSSTPLVPLAAAAGVTLDTLRRMNPDLSLKDLATPRVVNYRLLVPREARMSVEAEIVAIAARRAEEDRQSKASVEARAQQDQRPPVDGRTAETRNAETRNAENRNAENRTSDDPRAVAETRTNGSSSVEPSPQNGATASSGPSSTGPSSTGSSSRGEKDPSGRPSRGAEPSRTMPEAVASLSPSLSQSGEGSSSARWGDATRQLAYRVQTGNTIYQIARDFGTSAGQLREWNPQLLLRELWQGEVLQIFDLPDGFRRIEHKIRKGERLEDVANLYGVATRSVASWNGIRGDQLEPGATLLIFLMPDADGNPARMPRVSTSTAALAPTSAPASASTPERAPTSAPAEKSGSSEKSSSEKSSSAEGNAKNTPPSTEKPRSTETVSTSQKSSSGSQKSSSNELGKTTTGKASTLTQAGQEKAKEGNSTPEKASKSTDKGGSEKGADKGGSEKGADKASADKASADKGAGQKAGKSTTKIVSKEVALPDPVIYEVQKGNSLSVIASLFDVRVEDLRTWNKLKSDGIKAGEKLKIYPQRPLTTTVYKVKKGDTLPKVARKYKLEPEALAVANGLSPSDDLKSGQLLRVYRMD